MTTHKKRVVIAITAIIAILIAIFFLNFKAIEKVAHWNDIEIVAAKNISLRPELIPICMCESRLNHFESDGVTVKRGQKNPLDIGICQINLHYHGDEAKELGLDLFDENDNIEFANLLYEKQGSKPWDWSKSCWKNETQKGVR